MSLLSKVFQRPAFCLVPRFSSKANPSINSSIQRETHPTNVGIWSTSWPNNRLQLPTRHFSIYKAILNKDPSLPDITNLEESGKTLEKLEDNALGCRLFVFGINRDVQKEVMEEEFGQCGTVTDAYNTGKGYAFITFSTLTEAQECISKMNGKNIFGQELVIKMPRVPGSTLGCRLFVFGINRDVQREEMEEAFSQCGTVTDTYNTGKGYAFITFSSPSEARECISRMNGENIFGQKLSIKFPRAPHCRLFVFGIDKSVENEDIKKEFSRFGKVHEASNSGKGFAFVTFSRPSEAQDCISGMHGNEIFGQALRISIAEGKEEGGGGGGGGYRDMDGGWE